MIELRMYIMRLCLSLYKGYQKSLEIQKYFKQSKNIKRMDNLEYHENVGMKIISRRWGKLWGKDYKKAVHLLIKILNISQSFLLDFHINTHILSYTLPSICGHMRFLVNFHYGFNIREGDFFDSFKSLTQNFFNTGINLENSIFPYSLCNFHVILIKASFTSNLSVFKFPHIF